jgi:thiol-disulfide isomerase/thioredoxin
MRPQHLLVLATGLLSFGCGSPQAPAFEVFSVDGKETYTNDTYKGKVVMIDYWETWCGPCRQIQPSLHEMADHYATRGLVVLGVTGEAPKTVADFVKHSPLGYPAVLDRGDRVARMFHVQAFPTLIIINRDGSVAYNASPQTMDEIAAILDRLMPGSEGPKAQS